jgi:hypothetical protein
VEHEGTRQTGRVMSEACRSAWLGRKQAQWAGREACKDSRECRPTELWLEGS